MKDRPSQGILVVDDDELVRKATVALILKMGYACDAVSSGEKALARLQTEDFDIVLSDVVMNGMSGMEFMKRAKEGFPQSDFIIMTGYTSEYSYADIIKAGAIDYLAKPFEQAELQARLERAIKERTLFCKCNRTIRELEKAKAYALGLIESSPDALVILDKDGMITSVNEETVRLTGYASEELIGSQFQNYFTDPERAAEGIRKSFKEGKVTDHELVIKSKAGEKTPMSYNAIVYKDGKGQVEGVFAVARDITEHKRAEKALRESEQLYRTLFENSLDGVYRSTMDGRFIDANPALVKMLGYKNKEELTSIHIPKDLYFLESERPASTERNGIFCTRFKRKDGTVIWVEINSRVVVDENSHVSHYENITRDITEQKKASEKIESLNRNLRQAVAELQRKNAELKQVVTRLKTTQAKMLESDKMASIGQLAAGVAHEINNPTGFVSSNLKTLSDYHNDINTLIEQYRSLTTDLKETMTTAGYPVAISEQLERIADLEAEVDIDFVLNDISDLVKESREGTGRIKKIVLNLKDFAHPGEDKPMYADINKNMESTLNVVWNELKYKAKVVKEYGDLPEVQCYPQQLNQVFVNLLVNAAQAIEKEGEIKIVTEADDGCVEIRISDTGKGIPEENLSKIFDPFFTTKEVGKGTGLGLNVAYNIIEKHNGTIDAESTVGKGTMFTIRIPVQKEV